MPTRVRPLRRLLALSLLAGTAPLGGCVRECEVKPQCQGDTVRECRYGIDQLVGAGTPVTYTCAEPAPRCVEARTKSVSEDRFFCARAPLTECDDSFASTCEGATVHVFCLNGYVSAEDCTHQPGTGRCGPLSSGGPVQCLY